MLQIVEKSNLLLALTLFALLMRVSLPPIIGHPVNFSPLDAIALFCGAYYSRYTFALAMALLIVWVGDLFVNKMVFGSWVFFYDGFYWQYACYGLITLLGTCFSLEAKIWQLTLASFSASVLFFLVSNAGVWMSGTLYPHTSDGLLACYIAAIPFFKNTLLSDFIFSIVLFKSCAQVKRMLVPAYDNHQQ